MAQFEARSLTVRYGAAVALHDLDLAIAAGEIFVLLGGSGSGKTTLLRCIGGFLPASEGRLTLAGEDITAMPPHRRPVNTMFQSFALFPHMTVAGNVAFGLRGLARAEKAARVAELLALVSLPGFGARRVAELSGGQQQRVALARSLAPRPRLLLLDEPFSALDSGLREATRRECLSVLRHLGTTAILVTHDQDEALSCADRIGVLHGGRLAQVGTPADLYERPASRFVAGFLGAANLIEAVAGERHADGGTRLDFPGGPVRVAGHRDPGQRVVMALRPERLRLGAGAAGDNVLHGTVEAASYRGSALDVAVRLADGPVLRVSQPLDRGLLGVPLPGSAATVSWPPDAAVLLAE